MTDDTTKGKHMHTASVDNEAKDLMREAADHIDALTEQRDWWKDRATAISREHDVHPDCGWRCVGTIRDVAMWTCNEHGTVRESKPIDPDWQPLEVSDDQ